MLRRRTRTTCHVSTQIHANKKSTWRRRWKTSQSPLYSHLKTQHVVTCCERLHTSANIAQQETTLLGPTMLRVVASVCSGLYIHTYLIDLSHRGFPGPMKRNQQNNNNNWYESQLAEGKRVSYLQVRPRS